MHRDLPSPLNQGFTLIELLVVIAIIALLAAVVLPRLNSARDRGADALVQGNVSSLSAQAEIIYDDTNDYSVVCADPTILLSLQTASEKATGVTTNYVCNDSDAAWAAAVQLKRENQVSSTSATDFWCVDNSGQPGLRDTQLATSTDFGC